MGRRLALHVRHQVFGESLETDGPVFAGAAAEGEVMRVRFTHADGLTLHPAKTDGRVSFEVAGEDRKFVFFCAGGLRSALAAKTAQDMGLKPVAHIVGGFGAWKKAGGPVEGGEANNK